jgi:hypothetical protein
LAKTKNMRQFIILAASIAMLTTGCNNNASTTETSTVTDSTNFDATVMSDSSHAPMDSATVMQNWMAYMTPGDVHKMMESWSGTWNGEVTMWHAPGADPEVSNATAVNKMILGGRYLQCTTSGNMMGQPFEGVSTTAYDNAKKSFTNTWIDNMGTGIMVLEGPWDESNKTMSLSGKMVDPTAGTAQELPIRETFKIIDDKTQLMEMYGPGPDGKDFKMMTIKYTRK